MSTSESSAPASATSPVRQQVEDRTQTAARIRDVEGQVENRMHTAVEGAKAYVENVGSSHEAKMNVSTLLTHDIDYSDSVGEDFLKHCAVELDRVCPLMTKAFNFNKWLSAVFNTVTIVLNALIIGAQSLGLADNLMAYFAAINSVLKGLDMHFKFEHTSECLKKSLIMVKNLDARVHQLIVLHRQKANPNKLNREIDAFKANFDSVMTTIAEYIDIRGLKGLDSLPVRANSRRVAPEVDLS
jgi:hypothetical protein